MKKCVFLILFLLGQAQADLISVSNIGGGAAQRYGQIFLSSSTAAVTSSTGNFDPVPISSFTVSLGKATNQWLYIVSGTQNTAASAGFGALTIFRDNTNLGDSNLGLEETNLLAQDLPFAMTTLDAPGDTLPHTYIVKIKVQTAAHTITFPDNSNATFNLIELVQP